MTSVSHRGEDPLPGHTSQILRLQEENQFLALKLKYAQSVGTIYRQKITLLLREAGKVGGEVGDRLESAVQRALEDPALDDPTLAAAVGGDAGTVAGSSPPPRAVSGMATPASKSTSPAAASPTGRSASPGNGERADYWREQFLSLMGDTQPSNLHDAQALCGILHEKNKLGTENAKLRGEANTLRAQYGALNAAHAKLLTDRAVTAEDCVKELYRQKEADLEAKLLEVGAQSEECVGLREDKKNLEGKNKVLRLRVSQLRQQIQDLVADRNSIAATDESNHLVLLKQISELRAKCTVLEADHRRALKDVSLARQDIALRDNTVMRLEAKMTAMEAQAEAALRKGESEVGSAELQKIAALERQLDGFELHVRDLEKENKTLHGVIKKMEADHAAANVEVTNAKLQAELMEERAENFAKVARAAEAKVSTADVGNVAVSAVEGRLKAALHALEGEVTTRQLSQKMGAMAEQLEQLEAVRANQPSDDTNAKRWQRESTAFRAELERAAKLGVAPDLERVDEAVVQADLGGQYDVDRRTYLAETVLREQDGWREVRDGKSLELFYITSDVDETPFGAPKKPPTPPVQIPALSIPPANQDMSTSPMSSRAPTETPTSPRSELAQPDTPREEQPDTPRQPPSAPKTPRKSAEEYRAIISQVYDTFRPENPDLVANLDGLMHKFKGKERNLCDTIVKKYVPEMLQELALEGRLDEVDPDLMATFAPPREVVPTPTVTPAVTPRPTAAAESAPSPAPAAAPAAAPAPAAEPTFTPVDPTAVPGGDVFTPAKTAEGDVGSPMSPDSPFRPINTDTL